MWRRVSRRGRGRGRIGLDGMRCVGEQVLGGCVKCVKQLHRFREIMLTSFSREWIHDDVIIG